MARWEFRRRGWVSLGVACVLLLVAVGLTLPATVGAEPFLAEPYLPAAILVLAAGVLVARTVIPHRAVRGYDHLERENRGLLALHQAVLDVYAQNSLDTVLQSVVDQAAKMLEARYGAVSVVDDAGQVSHFVTSGVDREAYQGTPEPCGRSLIGVVRDGGERLRLRDVTAHPRFRGFPDQHPTMRSLLSVPIRCRGPFRGALFVAEKRGGPEFSPGDEEVLDRFATAAAIAIDHAHLHERLRGTAVVQERERIGREMHDGMAQLLAYVNAKAQAVDVLLKRGRAGEAREQLGQLARAARDAYVDARAAILDLRTEVGEDHALIRELAEYVERWEELADVRAVVRVEEGIHLEFPAELQLVRIVQETLTNVRKHADATEVTLEMRREGDRVVTRITDDGRGFDPGQLTRTGNPRFGLGVMRERAESVGGELRVETVVGRGTTVIVSMPGAHAPVPV